MNLSVRSYKKELLDGKNIPFADIRQNMNELNFINTWLGGHAITIEGFRKILQDRKKITVCEIGCGGGDNLLAIYNWCNKNNVDVQLTGIDYNRDCIDIAYKKLPFSNTQFITADYKEAIFDHYKPDIVFSSLFCHHFTNEELVYMLNWMGANAGLGFFINDLHRHFLAFYSIKILTRVFSKSYLVKNDAPLSVERGFIRKEWIELLKQSSVNVYSIQWKWAFRWLITCHID
ncbi:MAG: methyltransferase domain-containing protein [Bacteroidota bacterium]